MINIYIEIVAIVVAFVVGVVFKDEVKRLAVTALTDVKAEYESKIQAANNRADSYKTNMDTVLQQNSINADAEVAKTKADAQAQINSVKAEFEFAKAEAAKWKTSFETLVSVTKNLQTQDEPTPSEPPNPEEPTPQN